MNYNKEHGLIYWATAGCASRTNLTAFDAIGDRWTYFPYNNKVEKFGTFSHNQGIPPGCEGYKIICSIRNPYTRAVSAYIDLLAEGKTFSFKEYCLEFRYKNFPNDKDLHYWNEWQDLQVPDYFIRLEHIVQDWESIPEFMATITDWEDIKPRLVNNAYHGEAEQDEYDTNGHQKVTRFMDQAVADLIWEKDQPIFKIGQYARDSWK
jgi:hypothetical protein